VFERLLSPLVVGPVELPNRIVSTAHQTTLVEHSLPTDDFVAYHEARARGGVGLIVLEATAVHSSGLLTSHTLGGFLPEIADGYRRVAAAVQAHGTRLFVQLFHGGREQIATPPRAPALAPSAVPSPRFRTEPRSLRDDEIHELVAGYGRSAALAAEGGLDGIEVSAAHRYLIEQLFDPVLNKRSDEWADGRRFLASVLDAIREAAPGLVLGVRVSADSERGAAIAEAAADEGVDFVSAALGESSTYLGSVGIVPPPPVPVGAVASHAARIRFGPTVIATSRIVDPGRADELVAAGVADAVGMTRALIADPDLPRKARAAAPGRVLRCIGCNVCIAHYHAGTAIACAINPRTGRERTFLPASRADASRRMVVVGGGPAGLSAAVEAGEAGAATVLLERTARLGGQMALALAAPGAAAIARDLVSLYECRLVEAEVDVRLGVSADPELVAELEPDIVVVATGAKPFLPDLALDGVEVAQAWDVLGGPIPEGRAAVVADWGGDPTGLDVAEALVAAGNVVTLAVAALAIGEPTHQYRRNLYLQRLYRHGVEIVHHRQLVGAADGQVELANVFAPELRDVRSADLLVLAQGRVPEDSLAPALRSAGCHVEEAGDCLSPRSIEEAILEGALAARRVRAVA